MHNAIGCRVNKLTYYDSLLVCELRANHCKPTGTADDIRVASQEHHLLQKRRYYENSQPTLIRITTKIAPTAASGTERAERGPVSVAALMQIWRRIGDNEYHLLTPHLSRFPAAEMQKFTHIFKRRRSEWQTLNKLKPSAFTEIKHSGNHNLSRPAACICSLLRYIYFATIFLVTLTITRLDLIMWVYEK